MLAGRVCLRTQCPPRRILLATSHSSHAQTWYFRRMSSGHPTAHEHAMDSRRPKKLICTFPNLSHPQNSKDLLLTPRSRTRRHPSNPRPQSLSHRDQRPLVPRPQCPRASHSRRASPLRRLDPGLHDREPDRRPPGPRTPIREQPAPDHLPDASVQPAPSISHLVPRPAAGAVLGAGNMYVGHGVAAFWAGQRARCLPQGTG